MTDDENEVTECVALSKKAAFILTVFSIAIIMCGIGLSSLNNIASVQNFQGTYYFYGRYYEYMAMPLIIMGLYYILSKEIEKKTLLISAGISVGIYVLLSIFLQREVMPYVSTGTQKRLSVIGVLPYIGISSSELSASARAIPRYDLMILGFICMGVFLVLLFLLLSKKSKLWSLVILSIMFLYTTEISISAGVYSRSHHEEIIYARMDNSKAALDGVKFIYDHFKENYGQAPKLYIVTDSLGSNTIQKRSRAQLIFNKYTVTNTMPYKTFDTLKKPANMIVVSNEDHKLEERKTKPKYIKIHASPDAYIWVRGTEIQEVFRSIR